MSMTRTRVPAMHGLPLITCASVETWGYASTGAVSVGTQILAPVTAPLTPLTAAGGAASGRHLRSRSRFQRRARPLAWAIPLHTFPASGVGPGERPVHGAPARSHGFQPVVRRPPN